MNRHLKKLGMLAGLVGAVAGCNIDRNPQGIPVTFREAVIVDPCQPTVTFATDDPAVTVYATNRTVDHCGYITVPPGAPTPPDGKYVCPLLEPAHAPIGEALYFTVDSATGPNAALVDAINAQRGNVIIVQQWPKRVQLNSTDITGVTYPYSVDGSSPYNLNVQEGTWISNVEDFHPDLPENVRNSNATQVVVGVGDGQAGLEQLLRNGTLRVRVAQRGPNNTTQYEGTTQFSTVWYVPNAGIPTVTAPVKYIGGSPVPANP